MKTLFLPDEPILIGDLLDATSRLTPKIRGTARYRFEGSTQLVPLPFDSQKLARQVHCVELLEAVRTGKIIPRSRSTFAEWRELRSEDEHKVLLSFRDAATFCALLGVELRSSSTDSSAGQALGFEVSPTAPGTGLPWWQTAYNIKELAETKGATLHSMGRPTSTRAISVEIAKHINATERSKGREREAPNSDTIRGALTGWKYRPE